MSKWFEYLKTYAALVAILGITLSQLFNLRPAEQSLPAFVFFTLIVVGVALYCVALLRQRRLVRRGADFVHVPVHDRRTRALAVGALALTPVLYVGLTLAFHIPNTWPIVMRASAELRATNPRIAPLKDLVHGLNEEVYGLFVPVPDEGLVPDRDHIRRIAIHNRSTVPSPPLELRIHLLTPPTVTTPPARVYAIAVATPAEQGWLPLASPATALRWLPWSAPCGRRADAWCVLHAPDDTSTWLEPAIRLPSIPPRDSVEVYLELALVRGLAVRTIPASLALRHAAEGQFLVNVHATVDLNAGLR